MKCRARNIIRPVKTWVFREWVTEQAKTPQGAALKGDCFLTPSSTSLGSLRAQIKISIKQYGTFSVLTSEWLDKTNIDKIRILWFNSKRKAVVKQKYVCLN